VDSWARIQRASSGPMALVLGRRTARLCALLLPALSACASPSPAGQTREARLIRTRGDDCAFRVCINANRSTRNVSYAAENFAAVPATVSISFRALTNLRPTEILPVTKTVYPGQRVTLSQLMVVRPGRRVAARPTVTVDLGSDALEHRPSEPYAIPFGGIEPRQLSSGYGAPTHQAANHYAFDFAMPEGTPVLAARGGVVVWVQDGFSEGGLDPDLIDRANLVAVGHEDGTIASYGHLRDGLEVVVGDTVHTGQLLGWSGATGFAGIPHLHFHVGKRLMGGMSRTIPVEFAVGGDPATLVEGEWYLPSVEWLPDSPTASGLAPGAHPPSGK